jgi:hypothetical protein
VESVQIHLGIASVPRGSWVGGAGGSGREGREILDARGKRTWYCVGHVGDSRRAFPCFERKARGLSGRRGSGDLFVPVVLVK